MTETTQENTSFFDGKQYPKGSGFGGKFHKIPEELYDSLREPIPAEAIKPHPTKSYLSTIKAIYVAERLNKVFGIGGWDIEHAIIKHDKAGDKMYVTMAGRIYLREYDLYTPFQYGGHETEGKGTEEADGFKSAVTDVQSKCASFLEIGIDVFKGKGAMPPRTVSQPSVPKKEEPVKPKKEKAPAKKETPSEDDDIPGLDPTFKKYADLVREYDSAEELRSSARSIIDSAEKEGLSTDMLSQLKELVNAKYAKLKSQ